MLAHSSVAMPRRWRNSVGRRYRMGTGRSNQLRAFRVFGRQSVISRANALARAVQIQNDPGHESRYLEQVGRVVRRRRWVARRDFDPNACVVLEVQPA